LKKDASFTFDIKNKRKNNIKKLAKSKWKVCGGGIKKREDYYKVCRSLNEYVNLLMLIQTELLEVCPSAAGMGYGGCQQIHDQDATGFFK